MRTRSRLPIRTTLAMASLALVGGICSGGEGPLDPFAAFGPRIDLSMSVGVDAATAPEGGEVNFTLTVENAGEENATEVIAGDTLPTGLRYVSHVADPRTTYAPEEGRWDIGDLPVRGTRQLTILATVEAGTAGSTLWNRAGVLASEVDTVLANNVDSVSVFAAEAGLPQIDLAIEKSVDRGSVPEGDDVTFVITVTNPGPVLATAVRGEDVLALGLTYASHAASHQTTYSAGDGRWDIGELPAGATRTLSIDATVDLGTAGSTLWNVARVTANEVDSVLANNADSVSVQSTLDSGGGGVGAANPALLPIAAGQMSNFAAYQGGTLAAGQQYLDPVTGVLVVKLSDENTPFANNARGYPDYAEGGPHISQAWEVGGDTYYTVYLGVGAGPSTHYFVDVKHPELTLHNWRQLPNMENRDLMWAWSLNPSTPRVGYGFGMPGRNVLRKFDTGAMTELAEDNFPRSMPEQALWLQNSVNDTWFAFQNDGTKNQYAWNSVTDVLHTWNIGSLNEGHIDRNGSYLYTISRESHSCDRYGSVNIISLFRLSDGVEIQPSPAVTDWPDGCEDELWNTHIAGLRGRMVTTNPNAGFGSRGRWFYDYNPATDEVRFHHSEQATFASSGHRAGQWVFDNGDLDSQWYVTSNWGTGGQNHAFFAAVGFVNTDPGQPPRLLAHHYSSVTDYYTQPHATVSPDGKLVLWGSTMGVTGGRIDAFLARVPAG